MIRFFRNIRKQLAADNKPAKYMRYAIGEVLLIVLGIFLALQLQNWNEKRKERKAFEFGIKQMYRQLLYSYYDVSTSEDKLRVQLAYMDSIINYPELISPQKLPGIIQIFDYSGITKDQGLDEILEPYLKLNPNDEMQSGLALAFRDMLDLRESVQGWFKGTEYPISEYFNPKILFYEYLQKAGVSLRFLTTVESYTEFINPPSPNYYSEEELQRVIAIVNSKEFLADLKTTQLIKTEILESSTEIREGNRQFLDFLKESFPNAEYKIHSMEIIGSGTANGNWASGFPMIEVSEGLYELEIELQDGEVKFRTDGNWTFDWGGSSFDATSLVFKGSNIPVIRGNYFITLDINQNIYSIAPVE